MIERYTTPEMAALWSEQAKFESWLQVEKAVARVQGELGLIPRTAARAIQRASFKLEEIAEYEKETNHDVIAFVRSVARSLGQAGAYVHFGLTSYDVVDTALSLRILASLKVVSEALNDLRRHILRLAHEHRHTPMIGRTHGMHAEPITFGLKCLSWSEEVGRNLTRLGQAAEEMRYGKLSGTVGAYTQLPPSFEVRVLKILKLKPEPVSTQVIPRDRHAYLLCVLALAATGLERIATEIRNLQRPEIGELAEPFARGQRGSSAMPHKQNPIICERICGLARIVRGLAAVGYENIPLWHERDLTNSAPERIAIPGAFSLVHYITRKLSAVISGLVVRPDRMKENLEASGGIFFSQGLMLALVRAGVDRDSAYKLVQRLAFEAQETGRPFTELCHQNPFILKRLGERRLAQVFDLHHLLRHVDVVYRRTGLTRH